VWKTIASNGLEPCGSNPYWLKYEDATKKVSEIESKISNLQVVPNDASNETPPRQLFNTPSKRSENIDNQNSDDDSILAAGTDRAAV